MCECVELRARNSTLLKLCCLEVFMEVSLPRLEWLNHRPLVAASPLLKRSSGPQHPVSPVYQRPSSHARDPKGLWSCVYKESHMKFKILLCSSLCHYLKTAMTPTVLSEWNSNLAAWLRTSRSSSCWGLQLHSMLLLTALATPEPHQPSCCWPDKSSTLPSLSENALLRDHMV